MPDYFSHDYGSRNDPKLVKLQMKLGHEGKGIFWDLVEILYEQGGYIQTDELNSIAFALHSEYERMISVLSDFDLFKTDGQAWWSESILKRLEVRDEKSNRARESVLKRWDKYKRNTDVLQTNNDGNTIKERKKGKEINISFDAFWDLYDKKAGNKEKLISKWNKLSDDDRTKIMAFIPKYKIATPDKKYRKNPETFLNNKAWNDEIIGVDNKSEMLYLMNPMTERVWMSRDKYENHPQKDSYKILQQ